MGERIMRERCLHVFDTDYLLRTLLSVFSSPANACPAVAECAGSQLSRFSRGSAEAHGGSCGGGENEFKKRVASCHQPKAARRGFLVFGRFRAGQWRHVGGVLPEVFRRT